ncbi:outer membrane protein [Vibrio cholerae]|uniref:OmpA family protein n=1 Tax=Vibrio cholerae TaxID=666 RepID=UPI00157BA840|nr:OmpA family protein [Vibrio cholerae]EGQ8095634.1 OmpA family protein [Vibrio cholerae]EGR0593627.1 OmpA family protein [Vibrio cholerae]EGR1263077.1 OmpA family protein [Vibrio cholerae]ELT7571299.1 OmpA family protein [Vibrio cholerae]ELV5028135.1 OmpA family protein [Vibrio cholerae]
MQKNHKVSFILAGLLALTACSNQIRDDNLVLDYDWEPDVYNLVYSHVADADNLRFWVRRAPEYDEGSPHQRGCIEVAQPQSPNRFYIANLNTYGLIEVKNCDGDYSAFSNLIAPEKSRAFDVSAWQRSYGIVVTELDGAHWLLKFENLFVVNQYQLTVQGRHTLLAMLRELQTLPVESLLVYGVADSSGLYAKNQHLSDQRARVVREFLIEEGMRNIPIDIRASVENALPTAQERVAQRRFMIEVKLKNNEK